MAMTKPVGSQLLDVDQELKGQHREFLARVDGARTNCTKAFLAFIRGSLSIARFHITEAGNEIIKLHRMIDGDLTEEFPPEKKDAKTKSFVPREGSVKAQVLRLVQEGPGTISFKELQEILTGATKGAISVALCELLKAGMIDRRGRGLYTKILREGRDGE